MANAVEIVITATDKASGVIKGTTGGLGGLGAAFKSLTGFSLGGAAALTAVTGALKFSITAAADAERVMALTEAVIKSTGGAAGFTATQIADLSLEHSRLTGIEDEVTQSGNNMLLTFTAIGKDIFPRASMAMQDMAVAMNEGNLAGVDLKSSAILIGKALNVVAGDTAGATRAMSALQRVGVRFTDDQKEMGAELVKSGKVIEYQSLILGELETEFGGAAAAAGDTFAGQAAKLKNELGNLGEVIGVGLFPPMTRLTSELANVIVVSLDATDEIKKLKLGTVDVTQSYDEYLQRLDELRETAPLSAIGLKTLTKEEYNNETAIYSVVDAHEDWRNSLEDTTEATDDYSLALEDNEAAAEEAKEEQERLTQAFSDLKTIISGPVTDAYEDFEEKQGDLQGKVADLHGEIAELEAQEYLTEEQETRLGELQTELGESETALVDLAEQHEDTIERMIFGMAAEALARDGWQDGEIAALTELGLKWGIYDEATAAAMLAVENAVSGFNESGDMDTLIGDLDDAKNAAEDLSGTYNINVVTTYKQVGQPPKGGPIATPMQHGGPIMAGGAYLVGEAGPELFIPGQGGQIVPNNQISNYFNLTMHTNASQERVVEDFNMMRAMAGA